MSAAAVPRGSAGITAAGFSLLKASLVAESTTLKH